MAQQLKRNIEFKTEAAIKTKQLEISLKQHAKRIAGIRKAKETLEKKQLELTVD